MTTFSVSLPFIFDIPVSGVRGTSVFVPGLPRISVVRPSFASLECFDLPPSISAVGVGASEGKRVPTSGKIAAARFLVCTLFFRISTQTSSVISVIDQRCHILLAISTTRVVVFAGESIFFPFFIVFLIFLFLLLLLFLFFLTKFLIL